VIKREEALAALQCDSVEKRLEAARYFSRSAEVGDEPLLSRAHARESARWVKRALERAIDRIKVGPRPNPTAVVEALTEIDSDQLMRDVRAQAVDEVSRTILHEFAPLIGSLRLVAGTEVSNYGSSRTRHCIERLNGLLEAVGNLKKAASTPSYSEFDLSELVAECVAVLNLSNSEVVVRVAGIKPYVVQADRDSLGLAIDNGIRNAVEAVQEYSSLKPAEILINWGPAGAENWLAILDCGAGFVGNLEDAFKLGVSNKDEHFGYGLTTAQLSMRSMEGEVTIANNSGGGAKFELRWYRDYASIVR